MTNKADAERIAEKQKRIKSQMVALEGEVAALKEQLSREGISSEAIEELNVAINSFRKIISKLTGPEDI